MILQKYDFSSKSQLIWFQHLAILSCLWYCKSTIFQANHNRKGVVRYVQSAVCDTAKVRFFKQITTGAFTAHATFQLFVILQKYDFSSKSQPAPVGALLPVRCLWYCKSTIFQANHNLFALHSRSIRAVCDTAKVRFFKQITTTKLAERKYSKLFVILQKYDFSSKSQLLWYYQN